MGKRKVIIDTDPGTDDVLALLLALAASPGEIEVLLISVTYGNVDVQNCLRNLVSTFNVIEKELAWRKSQGLPEGFDTLRKCKPIVAVGPDEPLGGQIMMADYYHGVDGLGNVHTTHPHHTSPPDLWQHLFSTPPNPTLLSTTAKTTAHTPLTTHTNLFTPSPRSSSSEILHLLASHPPNTITLIALGPLTTFALAAAQDTKTFLRAREVIAMSGAISVPGNITPVGEFNCIADPIAAARIFALTSPTPESTMPPSIPGSDSNKQALGAYPPASELSPTRLSLTLFPLDITTPHMLSRSGVSSTLQPLIAKGSPLAEWVWAFLSSTFDRSASLYKTQTPNEQTEVHVEVEACFHDPVVVWYAISSTHASETGKWVMERGEDVRVETLGQWTRGMCVTDRRGRKVNQDIEVLEKEGEKEEKSSDTGGWLSAKKGNRLNRCVGTPGARALEPVLLSTIFGS